MLEVNIKLFKDNTCKGKVEVNDTYSKDLSNRICFDAQQCNEYREIATYFSNCEDYNTITVRCMWIVEELTQVSSTSFLPKDKGRGYFFTMLVKKKDFGINIYIYSTDMEADYLNEEDIYDLITEMVHELYYIINLDNFEVKTKEDLEYLVANSMYDEDRIKIECEKLGLDFDEFIDSLEPDPVFYIFRMIGIAVLILILLPYLFYLLR